MWRFATLARGAARSAGLLLGGLLLIAGAASTSLVGRASAQVQETLRVEVDKAHLIQLDKNAATVMIADPEIADVTVESPRIVFVLGRAVGETTLYVLDADGNRMVDANVVVEARSGAVEPEPYTPAPSFAATPAPARQKEMMVTVFRNVNQEETLTCTPVCSGGGGSGGGGSGGGYNQPTGGGPQPAETDLDPTKSKDVKVPLQ